MEIGEDSSRRIRDLEAEFSDEVLAEIFPMGENSTAYVSGRLGRLTGRAVARYALVVIAVIACIAAVLQAFTPRIALDASMGDTVAPRDCVFVARLSYVSAGPRCGDVILHGSRAPGAGRGAQGLINRVVGLPGDVVEIRDGSVFRNGERLDEPYVIGGRTDGAMKPSTVPEGCCFVLADDRRHGVDSRDGRVGFVPEAQIKGKVVFRLLPASRAGRVF